MFVKQFHNKNQFVLEKGNGKETVFQSYKSKIVSVKHGGPITLYPNWDKSNTTRKHLYMFIRQYTNLCVNSKKDMEDAIKNKMVKLGKYKHNPQPFNKNEYYY